jgi:hypothetical protein
MWFIPIHISSIEIEVHAPRNLIFQRLTDFGTTVAGAEMSSQVLSRDGDRLLVEFKTPILVLFGIRKVFRTVEWVTPHKPEWIEFEEVEGPFAMRRERISLEEKDGNTCEFGVKGWVLGWLPGVLLVRPKLQGAVRKHMKEMKETVEALARKS